MAERRQDSWTDHHHHADAPEGRRRREQSRRRSLGRVRLDDDKEVDEETAVDESGLRRNQRRLTQQRLVLTGPVHRAMVVTVVNAVVAAVEHEVVPVHEAVTETVEVVGRRAVVEAAVTGRNRQRVRQRTSHLGAKRRNPQLWRSSLRTRSMDAARLTRTHLVSPLTTRVNPQTDPGKRNENIHLSGLSQNEERRRRAGRTFTVTC